MSTMPEELRGRQTGGEEARFTWAFNECLRLYPDEAPTPTRINILLEKPPPLNILTGRKSVLRRRLLVEAGFVQENKWGRWRKPPNLYRLQTEDGESYSPSTRDKVNALIESGGAEWVGTDFNEEVGAYVHYADRIK
jgi:hypothetical protein